MSPFNKMKILWIGFAVLLYLTVFNYRFTLAADEVDISKPYATSTERPVSNSLQRDRSFGSTRDKDVTNLIIRIEELERQLGSIAKQVRISNTSFNMISENKSLASDAWDIAVEARTIALRAERKADKALNNAE